MLPLILKGHCKAAANITNYILTPKTISNKHFSSAQPVKKTAGGHTILRVPQWYVGTPSELWWNHKACRKHMYALGELFQWLAGLPH